MRRPSRAVSLGDVREQPVQTMGAAWPGGPELFHGSVDNITEFAHVEPTNSGGGRLRGVYTTPDMELAERYALPGRSDKPKPGGFRHTVEWTGSETPRVLDLQEPVPEELRKALPGIEIAEDATTYDLVKNNPGDWSRSSTRDPVAEVLPELYDVIMTSGERAMSIDVGPGEWFWLHPEKMRSADTTQLPPRKVDPPYVVSQGLSDADRRLVEQPGGFMPSPPMSGTMPGAPLQPPRLPDVGGFQASPPMSGLLPGAPVRGPQKPTILSMEGEGSQNVPPWALTPEQRAAGKEWLPEVRKTLEGTRPVADNLNPQSRMSQTMLADMFAQQAARQQKQSEQGYFGGLGEAVGNMSTEQKIALALGLSLLTGGGASPMIGPALGIGAGLAATQ